jgi:hypothetical protein
MDHVLDTADWQRFERPEFRVRFSYPTLTPQGQPVARVGEQRDGAVRVHLSTPDRQELYFEVVQFPNLTPREEYLRHRPNLEQRFGADSTTALTEVCLGRWPAWAYAFRGDQIQRAVLLLPVDRDTYRIIYDPRSLLNRQVLATLTLVE